MVSPNKTLGERIRQHRKLLKYTQKELADKIGFSSSETISQIETGERELKAWELAKLAKILSVDLLTLLDVEEPKKQPPILWRKIPVKNKELKEGEFFKRCQQYAMLEELTENILVQEFPQKWVTPEQITYYFANRAEVIAQEIRRELNLGDKPALSLENMIQERYQVKVWYDEIEDGSAASTIGPFGPAILMNIKEAPWRRNYNFAHEVFHLITWNSLKPTLLLNSPELWERAEKAAEIFASCLLLPGEIVRAEFDKRIKKNKISYSDLVWIARTFGVSAKALLYRLLNLKLLAKKTVASLMENELFLSIDRSTMAPCWWTPPKIPERFVSLAFLAYQKGKLSKAKFAQLMDCSLLDLSDFLKEYGFDDREGYNAEVRAS